MTVPTFTLRVSTSAASAWTRTVSSSPPIFIVTLTDRVSPTASTMPVCSKLLNPLSFALNLYGPTGRLVKTYSPLSAVMTNRFIPVSVCVTVTSTPGSAAPD